MPRIEAATVAEHRDLVLSRLIDAAEAIVRDEGADKLTAGAVTARAGIARNSIYRYVDSVDDLAGLVIARHLPEWLAGTDAALAGVDDPAERLVTWVAANLEQATVSGHGWLMRVARTLPRSGQTSDLVDEAHSGMRDVVWGAWSALLPGDAAQARVASALTQGMVDAAFRQLDAGVDGAVVSETTVRAVRGMLRAFS